MTLADIEARLLEKFGKRVVTQASHELGAWRVRVFDARSMEKKQLQFVTGASLESCFATLLWPNGGRP